MNLIVLLIIILLLSGGGYIGVNHGWGYGSGISLVGVLVVLLFCKLLGVI